MDVYVGIPWKEKGRGSDGCDCWGLVCIVYAEQLGIALPTYSEYYTTVADREHLSRLINEHKTGWHEVLDHEVRKHDVVLMTEAGETSHVGLVNRPGDMLHMPRGKSSVIEPYTSLKLRRRVIGFYRHEAML